MLDLDLLRIRSLSVANALTIVAAAGFYAYVLYNVLFLTTVWGYSVLDAGLALTAGPFVAAAVARPASHLAARIGYRPVLVAGALTWAAGRRVPGDAGRPGARRSWTSGSRDGRARDRRRHHVPAARQRRGRLGARGALRDRDRRSTRSAASSARCSAWRC